MTKPLTPPDCDLRDFPRMMIDIPRLRGSDFDATLDDSAWRAGLNLWLTAWHQVPAASLSNDDASLAKAAGLGRDQRTWRKVRDAALRGWKACSDGRLYHPTISELALEAWIDKLGQRLSSGAGNAKRYGGEFDPEPLYAEIKAAAERLMAINPKSRALSKQHVHKALRGVSVDLPVGDNADLPVGAPVRSQGKGREGNIDNPQKPPEGAFSLDLIFQEAWNAYPLAGRATTNQAKSYARWQEAVRSVPPEQLVRAVRAFAESAAQAGSQAKAPPAFHTWLKDRRFEAFLAAPGATPVAAGAAWNGPPEVFALANHARNPARARRALAAALWRHGQLVTDSPTNAAILKDELEAPLKAHDIQVVLEERAA